ncbi:hypothetical protein GCM10009765_23430 [Fodinicola feengrottensis]|uniref:Uncharacterized protein n=1 Tax=Fodinicola feengrottensis TaxID=435914 RepID=A0ABN2GLQ7_9ACTN
MVSEAVVTGGRLLPGDGDSDVDAEHAGQNCGRYLGGDASLLGSRDGGECGADLVGIGVVEFDEDG